MRIFFLLVLFISIIIIAPCTAQEGAYNINTGETLSKKAMKKILPDSLYLFEKEEPLQLTIESNFRKLRKNKNKDEYQEALLHYQLNDSILIKRKIKIKARGELRKRICYFPPIKVNLKKTKFYVNDIKELEKLKMVTKCKGSKTYETYLLKEYLVYKIYNLFTEMSFKSRLLKVKYIDTGRKNRSQETYAFLIEEPDKMALRNNAGLARQKNLGQTSMDSSQMDLVAVFEYMIGNTDWSIPNQHNMKLIKVLDINKPAPYPVPYDFDYSGLVDAEYAIPTEKLNIESVRDRLFLGYCRTNEEYQETINIFLEKEQAVYDLINDVEYLGSRDKKEMVDYLEEFYRLIRKPGSAQKLFKRTCKN
jgi:hypothetical protein